MKWVSLGLFFKLSSCFISFIPLDTSYQLPGMGSGMTHGSVSLPPPSHHTSDAVTLPPPLSNTWKPRTEKYEYSMIMNYS